MSGRRWQTRDFRADPVALAIALLGQRLVRPTRSGARVSGLIVETEAYLGAPDLASHARRGLRTPRNQAMYADAGTLYVYFTYGMHHCMNVVCGGVGEPLAVLLRAIAPDEGMAIIRRRRRNPRTGVAPPDVGLCDGPGKLCQALAVDRRLNGIDLASSKAMWIEDRAPREKPEGAIERTPRIGVAYAGEWAGAPLRFVLRAPQRERPPIRAIPRAALLRNAGPDR